jgi:hypothetical protein
MVSRSGDQDLSWVPEVAARLLRSPAEVVPFVGAGISIGAGIPSGSQLAAELLRCGSDRGVDFSSLSAKGREDCRLVADHWARRDPALEGQVREAVAEIISAAEREGKPSTCQRELARTPSRICLTLNYDLSLERAAAEQQIEYRSVLVPQIDNDLLTTITHPDDHPLLIIHLHGSLADRDSLVLAGGGYLDATLSPGLDALLEHVLRSLRVCLLGVSFDEGYIATLFQKTAPSVPRHVFVGQAGEVEKIQSGRAAISEASHAITFAPFPDGAFAVLDAFARHLTSSSEAPTEEFDGEISEEPYLEDEEYVPVSLIRAEDEASERDLAWKIALGQVDLLGEDQLDPDRCLIRGAPGSGKTSLLRHIAHTVKARGGSAMFVSLRSVARPTAGRPEEILAAWASRAECFGRDRNFEVDALRRRRVHVLLDGLDELPAAERTATGALVIGLAEAMPQHRFVLAARPIDTLELFPAPPWTPYVLQIRDEWREEFLRRRGLELADVVASVPGLEGSASLLSIPFFLRTVLELQVDGDLAKVRDLRELSSLLIRARAESDPTLPAAEHLMPWMRRVALAMTIAGTTSATLEDLRRFPIVIPRALGDLEALAEQLVNRTLLMSEDGRYSFQHRLMQEALCAEELESLGPGTEVVETICPRVSATVAGIRAEWAIPVGMICHRSVVWREALRDRDPLLVARSVPGDASPQERRWAADTLWSTYLETRLWMHDRHGARPVEDAQVLAELLKDPALEEVQGEVIAGLDVDQRQIRSNAIEVLGGTNWPGLLAATRAILVSDGDFVVRRHAAGVARDRGFDSLFEPLLRRALEADDQSEVDAMSAAAIELAPNSELLRTAMMLAAKGGGRSWVVESGARRRLKPADRLRYLRALTELKEDVGRFGEREFEELLGELRRPGAKMVEDVGWIAACWQLRGEVVLEWLRRHRGAALGVVDAIDSGRAWLFQAAPLLTSFSEEDLRRVGAPETTLIAARRQAEASAPSLDARPFDPPEPDPAEPTLPDCLRMPPDERDWMVMHNAQFFASQVAELEESDRKLLRARLGRWWRKGELREAVRRTGRHQWSIAHWAGAWINYGPPLEATLRPDQWAELAVCGFGFDDLHSWLRNRYSPRGAVLAAEMIGGHGLEGWAQLLDCIPRKPPHQIIDAMLAQANRVDDPDWLDRIGARLVKEGDRQTTERLAANGSGFRKRLRPHLAALGDRHSQRLLMGRLLRSVRKGENPAEVRWLEGARDPDLLDDLVEALAWSQAASEHLVPDVSAPLQTAIERIGGEPAVEAFDRVLAADEIPGVHFLRIQREAVVQDLLSRRGNVEGNRLSEEIALPRIDPLP